MSLVDEALSAPECVVSVMGPHAGEDSLTIFGRKMKDCETAGRTFWVAKSAKARPAQVQDICRSGRRFVLFVEPASPGGARPTTGADFAIEYSPDRVEWSPLPVGLGPVTGQMDASATAFVFDRLSTDVDRAIDLWAYADFANPDNPLRFALGLSTAIAIRKDTSGHPRCMKSRYRRLVAVARLVDPYCVWLK